MSVLRCAGAHGTSRSSEGIGVDVAGDADDLAEDVAVFGAELVCGGGDAGELLPGQGFVNDGDGAGWRGRVR
ncbi:MAG TPA: hypothetical protein VNH18_10400 [Bryobacteraceae bacterium]|nr:hypothetical protein [Bryobacteraceae bacterium]